jgi:hypothetical protein
MTGDTDDAPAIEAPAEAEVEAPRRRRRSA